ncbi:regulator of telomere elongation helicase 1 homolog [Drosophila ficusphila]|uniref:regulator of telomere elongation helicase 1 homolog n=1 Tax=Drosophila ficusphila TaxID=30025 RepID=UPI001C894CA9|nr:regulator of telomere elongation helicase 1 homolog [Drosophila ficusphila]
MANSIKTWTAADYASAAGRKLGGSAPNAMDFMSRLDSNVSSIDFNCCTATKNDSSGLVKIHKRDSDSAGKFQPAAQLG